VQGIHFTRRFLELADGGVVALDWLSEWQNGQPLLLLLHGLTGGSQENYMQHLADVTREHGYCVVVLTARGCNETVLTTAHGFSACWTADVRATVRYLRRMIDVDTPFFAAGVSLGGSILARYLVEEGSACTLQGAALLCPSLDNRKSTQLMESGLNSITYNRILAGSLVRYAKIHEKAFKVVPEMHFEDVVSATSIRDFDCAVVVPTFGFDSVHHYYSESTTGPLMERHVGVPTLVAHAADDPICCPSAVPTHAPDSNPNIIVAMTSTGGHVSWMQGLMPGGRSWVEEPVAQFFDALQKWSKEPQAALHRTRPRAGVALSEFTDSIHQSAGAHGEEHLAAKPTVGPFTCIGERSSLPEE
jgi:predicted alpha/beta-fold hydrolase